MVPHLFPQLTKVDRVWSSLERKIDVNARLERTACVVGTPVPRSIEGRAVEVAETTLGAYTKLPDGRTA